MKSKKRNELVDGLSKTPIEEILERKISFVVTGKQYSKWSQTNNIIKGGWFEVTQCGIERIGIKIESGFSIMNFTYNKKWDNYSITIVPLTTPESEVIKEGE